MDITSSLDGTRLTVRPVGRVNAVTELRVYVTDVSALEDESLYEKLYARVSDYRRHKTDALRRREDRMLSLGAEYLLMRACEDFGIDYDAAEVVRDGLGKPHFKADTDPDNRSESYIGPNDVAPENAPKCESMFFNLSHSGTKAMCVMSNLPVGCDVERVRPIERDIASRFFSAEECALLGGCESETERLEMFFRIWTLKESLVKCIGKGLGYPFEAFTVVPGALPDESADEYDGRKQVVDSGYVRGRDSVCDSDSENYGNHVSDGDYRLFEAEIPGGYKYSFCVRCDDGIEADNIMLYEVPWDDFAN